MNSNELMRGDRTGTTISARDIDAIPTYMVRHREIESETPGLISPRFLYRALTSYLYLTIPFSILFAGTFAAVVLALFTPVYRGSAVMKIASYTPYIAYMTPEAPIKSEEFTQTQVELIRSPLVLERILDDKDVSSLTEIQAQRNPVSWLVDLISIKQIGSSELYTVSLETTDPKASAVLVNAILDAYFEVRANDDESQTSRVLELLAKEKDARAAEIQRLRESIRQLGHDMIGADPLTGLLEDVEQRPISTPDKLRERLTSAEVDRKMLEMEITVVGEAIEKEEMRVAEVDVEMAVSDSQEVIDLRTLIADRTSMLHRIESTAAGGKKDPAYQRLQREIEVFKKTLAETEQKTRPKIVQQLESIAKLNRRDALHELESRLETQLVLEELLQRRYQESLGSASATGNKVLELEFARSELEREERVFEMIAERSMALSTESRAPGRVALMQPAVPPKGPTSSFPLRNLTLATLFGGLLPFGLALAWELSVKPICSASQITSDGQISVVREVAKLPASSFTFGLMPTKATSIFEESIDSLRIGISLTENTEHLQVIAVTSAVQSEGKSSVASQLAVSIGRATQQPVLLLDGDLRAPDVHNIFQISNRNGLASVLLKECSLEDAIVRDWGDHIHLLPAGRLRVSPHQLVTMSALQSVFDELRKTYRFIIVDTPPLLSASESLVMARCADGTILCTRCNASREHQVRSAYERLVQAGVKPLGAVLNGVSTAKYVRTYGSYSYPQGKS